MGHNMTMFNTSSQIKHVGKIKINSCLFHSVYIYFCTSHLSIFFGDPSLRVPYNYTLTTQHGPHSGWPHPSNKNADTHTHTHRSFHQVHLLSNFPHNYIPSTILNESPNYSRPVIVCRCSGKDAIT